MKNQNDMIVSIVAIVLALITLGILFGTRPQPKIPPGAPTVDVAPPTFANISVPMVNGVGGSGGTGGGRAPGPGSPGGGGGGAAQGGGFRPQGVSGVGK